MSPSACMVYSNVHHSNIYLYPSLGQTETLTEFLPHERVRVVSLVEESFQLAELFHREVGSRSPLLCLQLFVVGADRHRSVRTAVAVGSAPGGQRAYWRPCGASPRVVLVIRVGVTWLQREHHVTACNQPSNSTMDNRAFAFRECFTAPQHAPVHCATTAPYVDWVDKLTWPSITNYDQLDLNRSVRNPIQDSTRRDAFVESGDASKSVLSLTATGPSRRSVIETTFEGLTEWPRWSRLGGRTKSARTDTVPLMIELRWYLPEPTLYLPLPWDNVIHFAFSAARTRRRRRRRRRAAIVADDTLKRRRFGANSARRTLSWWHTHPSSSQLRRSSASGRTSSTHPYVGYSSS